MKKGILLIIPAILILMGCGGGKQNDPTPAPVQVSAPNKVALSAPAINSVCTTGTIISATQSSISFSWAASSNTDSYDLYLKNLLNSAVTTQNVTATQATVTLLRNTPYSWYIVSKSTKTTTTAQSDVWKFYNAGSGTVTYAPFPAEITSPTFAQNVSATAGAINLAWAGSPVNTGTIVTTPIATYDVYFGTTNTPPVLKSGVADSFLNNVAVTSKTTYYWKVITKDALGNTSDSGLYQFNVN